MKGLRSISGAVNFCSCTIAIVFWEWRNYRSRICQSSNKICWAVKGDAGLHGGIPVVQVSCNSFVSKLWTYEAQVTCARGLLCNCTWRSYKEFWWNFYTIRDRQGIICFFQFFETCPFSNQFEIWNRDIKAQALKRRNFWKLFYT